MKFEIKHRLTGVVLFALECGSLKLCVEAAVKEKAYLRGADLGGAYLVGAYLVGANLRGANLRGADLGGADLGGANLVGANLRGADLGGADLGGANLVGADLAAHIGQPDGWNAWTYYDTKAKEQRVQVGCRNYTLEEGRKYWAKKENRREVLAALDFAEAIGKIRGWGND